MGTGIRLLTVLSVVALLLVPAAAAPAAAPSEPPVVFHLRPAFGAVVDAGPTAIRAVGMSDREIVETELTIDGSVVEDTRVSGDDGRERTVAATVDLAAGDHVARLRVVDAAGRARTRAWRFTSTGTGIVRHAAAGPVAQSVALSGRTYPQAGARSAAVLARADDLADALTGVPLAHHLGAPLLLTDRRSLSPRTRTELARVLADGADVHVLGGGGAVASAVDRELRDLGFRVLRHYGPDRYATAAAIAAELPAPTRVFVASGTSFADALAASAPAARDGVPILLTATDRLSDATTRFLRDHDVEEAVIAGGTGVVSAPVAERIRREVPSVVRLGGRDRTATAAAIVDRYYRTTVNVGVAAGGSAADALLGARHAAATDTPLLLVGQHRLGAEVERTLGRLEPTGIHAYGGSDVLPTATLHDARRAIVNGPDAARLRGSDPAAGTTVHALDTIVLEFDRELDLGRSDVYVTLDGVEVLGTTLSGDFTSTLVFQVDHIHTTPRPNVAYPVVVTAAVHDGTAWARHELGFTYVKRQLARGDAGSEVEWAQRRLTELGYWLGPIDGAYGNLTAQAVMAFEKVHGLRRDGVLDDRAKTLLETAERPRAHTRHAYALEIDKTRQVAMFTRYGRVEWVLNTSTGTEEYYTHEGQRRLATTPTGTFRISRQIDGMRDAPLGKLWRPKYFNGGIAIHGSTSVPAYPASHGCARVSYAAIDWIWANDLAPIGTTVVVHD